MISSAIFCMYCTFSLLLLKLTSKKTQVLGDEGGRGDAKKKTARPAHHTREQPPPRPRDWPSHTQATHNPSFNASLQKLILKLYNKAQHSSFLCIFVFFKKMVSMRVTHLLGPHTEYGLEHIA